MKVDKWIWSRVVNPQSLNQKKILEPVLARPRI